LLQALAWQQRFKNRDADSIWVIQAYSNADDMAFANDLPVPIRNQTAGMAYKRFHIAAESRCNI